MVNCIFNKVLDKVVIVVLGLYFENYYILSIYKIKGFFGVKFINYIKVVILGYNV